MANNVQQNLMDAIYDRLTSISGYSGASGQVYSEIAPQSGVVEPYVIFNLITDQPVRSLNTDFRNPDIQITVYDKKPFGVNRIRIVGSQIHDAFNRQSITVSGLGMAYTICTNAGIVDTNDKSYNELLMTYQVRSVKL